MYRWLLAGLVCGLLWEFWNYWAIARWEYVGVPVPPEWKLFETPMPGYLGPPSHSRWLRCIISSGLSPACPRRRQPDQPTKRTEGNTRVATKRGKSTGAKKGKDTPRKPASKPMRASAAVRTSARTPTSPRPAGAPKAPARVESSARESAQRLLDTIQRSKVTHPDPWRYTTKARGWAERARRLVDEAAVGRDIRRPLDALTAEVDGDPDFRVARRLF